MSVRAMKAGAVDFLAKPFRDQDMLDAVAAAIQRDRHGARSRDACWRRCAPPTTLLTAREREVMALVTAGLMNKQVAGQLGLSEITVKIHRGHAMRKMNAQVAGRSRADGREPRASSAEGTSALNVRMISRTIADRALCLAN